MQAPACVAAKVEQRKFNDCAFAPEVRQSELRHDPRNSWERSSVAPGGASETFCGPRYPGLKRWAIF